MNKKLLAVAVAGALSAPVVAFAQSSVTISGNIKMSMQQYKLSNAAAARAGQNTSQSLVHDDSSRIIFNMTEDLGAGLQAIETLLAEHSASGQFCHGERPTIADICLVTQVTPAMTFNLSLDPYPRVRRVYDTCMAIPAFADAHPSKQPDAE